MTCIVGLIDGKTVYMGADSAVTGHVTQTLVSKKIFQHGKCLIGYSGSLRMANLLKHAFTPPEHPKGMEDEKYLTTLFVDALRTVLKDAGNATKINEQESGTGYFLVGYQCRLFEIGFDYSVSEVANGFDSVGSGNQVALGAIHATRNMSLIPSKRIELALEAAADFCYGVRGPFYIETLDAA